MFFVFSAQRSKYPRRFLEIDPECLHTFCVGHFLSFFRRKVWTSENHNTKTYYKVKYIWPLKTKHIKLIGYQGFICAECQGISPTNRVDIGCLTRLGGLLEPPFTAHLEDQGRKVPRSLMLQVGGAKARKAIDAINDPTFQHRPRHKCVA